MALTLVILILIGKWIGFYDPGGRSFSAADDRRFLVEGTLRDKMCTAGSLRLVLDHLSFQMDPSGSCSDVYRNSISELNRILKPDDRMQILLSAGGDPEFDLYGSERAESSWGSEVKREDQTDIFDALKITDRAAFYGKCSLFETATNPGQFDSRQYYLARGIVLKMGNVELKWHAPQDLCLPQMVYAGWRNTLADLRCGMQRGLLQVFGPEDAALIAACCLGDRSGLDNETQDLFREGGASYLMTVSSLHITVLGMAVYHFLRKRRRSFVLSSAVSAFSVVSFAFMAGFSISAQRAMIMFILWLGAQIFGREADRLTSLSIAAIFILLRQNYALWDASFLLSFSTVLSMECLSPAFERLIRPKNAITKQLCTSLGLWFGTLPVSLWFFYQITPWSVFLNLIVLPGLGLFLGFALAGSIAGGAGLLCVASPASFGYLATFWHAAGQLMAVPVHFLLQLVRLLCSLEREIPGCVVILGRPSLWQVILYYVLAAVFVFVLRKLPARKMKIHSYRALVRVTSAFFLCVLLAVICARRHPEMRFSCLDIGQGSCNLIEQGDFAALFDAGSSTVNDVWKYRIDSTLKYYGISELDAVFLSHGDLDHVDGIEQMLALYHTNLLGTNAGDVTIRRLFLPESGAGDERLQEIVKSARICGIEIGYVSEGVCISHGNLKLDILSPSSDRLTGNANEDCIVCMLNYPGLEVLMTGDLEKEGEAMFVRDYRNKAVFARDYGKQAVFARDYGKQAAFARDYRKQAVFDRHTQDTKADAEPAADAFRILIAGHHGSGNATGREFLDMLQPDLALISCGRNNRYGHPAQEMLDRLDEKHIPHLCTANRGQICISLKKDGRYGVHSSQ